MDPTPVTFRPRFWPRDISDIVILLFIALPFQLFPLFVMPMLIVLVVSESIDLAFSVSALIYLVFLAFSVWSVRAETTGLRFKRLFGAPKFLPWSDIRDVREATRFEVVLHGWIWPLLPAREMTPAMSARGHIRLAWDGGYCYFPPRDPEEFLAYVQKRMAPNVA